MKKLSAIFVMAFLVFATAVCVHAAEFDVVNTTLKQGVAYDSYSDQIEMSDGNTSDYTFKYVSGLMPKGLTVHSDGSITGTPTSSGNFASMNILITKGEESRLVIFNVSIMPRSVTVNISAPDVMYDGMPHTASYVCKDTDGNEIDAVPIIKYGSQWLNSATNAGRYYLTVMSPPGCLITQRTGDTYLNILTKPVTSLTVDNAEFDYDGKEHALPVSNIHLNPVEAGYAIEYKKSGESDFTSDVPMASGTYTVRVYTTNSNYDTVSANAVLTINAEDAAFTIGGTTAQYDGKEHEVTVTSVPADIEYNVTYTDSSGNEISGKPVNAGTYNVLITLKNPDAYNTPTGTSGTLTISPQPIRFTVNSPISYTAAAQKPSVETDIALDAEKYEITYLAQDAAEGTEPAATVKDPGTYNVFINVKDSNYKVSADSTSTVSVEAQTVNFRVTNYNNYTYDKTPHKATVTPDIEGFAAYTVTYTGKNGQNYTQDNPPVNAGDYTITVAVTDSSYVLGTVDNTTLSIAQMPLTFSVTGNESSIPYDKQPHYVEVTAKDSSENTVEADGVYTVAYKLSGSSQTPVKPGEYAVDISVTNDNYKKQNNDTFTLTITSVTVNFTVSENEYEYDGETKKAKFATDPEDFTDYSVKYTAANGTEYTQDDPPSNAGTYTITVTSTDDGYTIGTVSPNTLVITSNHTIVVNNGNSPAALIMNDTAAEHDDSWKTAALEAFKANRHFDTGNIPTGLTEADAAINYPLIKGIDVDADPATVIIDDIKKFTDPGITVDGEPVAGSEPVEDDEIKGLYTVTYTYDDGEEKRYVVVINRSIGDANSNGVVNAIDANYIDKLVKEKGDSAAPSTIAEARVWDVTKDGYINSADAYSIRHRFDTPLVMYYSWLGI